MIKRMMIVLVLSLFFTPLLWYGQRKRLESVWLAIKRRPVESFWPGSIASMPKTASIASPAIRTMTRPNRKNRQSSLRSVPDAIQQNMTNSKWEGILSHGTDWRNTLNTNLFLIHWRKHSVNGATIFKTNAIAVTPHMLSPWEAREPEACKKCHTGLAGPHDEMYASSLHGTIYATNKNTTRAPPVWVATCIKEPITSLWNRLWFMGECCR